MEWTKWSSSSGEHDCSHKFLFVRFDGGGRKKVWGESPKLLGLILWTTNEVKVGKSSVRKIFSKTLSFTSDITISVQLSFWMIQLRGFIFHLLALLHHQRHLDFKAYADWRCINEVFSPKSFSVVNLKKRHYTLSIHLPLLNAQSKFHGNMVISNFWDTILWTIWQTDRQTYQPTLPTSGPTSNRTKEQLRNYLGSQVSVVPDPCIATVI